MQKKEQDKNTLCKCAYCRKEIPLSAAFTPEGADYVRHFCSYECYGTWFKEREQKSARD